MIAEALKYLTDLTARSLEPIPLPGNAHIKRVAIGGQVHSFDLEPEPRDHRAGSLDDLIRLANRFDAEPAPGDDESPPAASGAGMPAVWHTTTATDGDSYLPVVWYDPESVVLVIDDEGHRIERATLKLEPSDVFTLLRKIRAEKPWYEQKPFVRLLRIDLAGTLDPVVLLEKVRKLRWENSSATTGAVGRQAESLGREINNRVDSAEPIPEEVVLQVPVYRTPGETRRWPLRCTVDADPALGRLQLLPLPDEIERVLALATEDIGARLREGLNDSIPCYLGRP